MKKNVVFWCAVNNPEHSEKYGNFEWFEYSKKSWQYWCSKHNVLFYEYTTPTEKDLIAHRVTWQRWFDVFDQLDNANINYDKIFMVDASSIIHWDAPNVFDYCKDNKIVAWRDADNLNWIYHSILGWKEYFNNFNFDITKYINCGSVIINESHKEFLQIVKDFYYTNYSSIMELQNSIKKGTDQTPFNYLLQINNEEVSFDAPIAFNLRHLHKKEMFGYNWQLNEDPRPYFVKYGYICRFTGFPKHERSVIMKQVWDYIKHNYSSDILDTVNHKNTFKNATTKKFKQDILDYFKDKNIKTSIEFGCCHGDTTKILSYISDNVFASDIHESNIIESKKKCSDRSNITFEVKDVNDEWKFETPDLIYLDALHDKDSILNGLNRINNQYPSAIIIMDDYGHEMNTVKPVIDQLIEDKKILVLKWIGESAGYEAQNGKKFLFQEGLIFKFI